MVASIVATVDCDRDADRDRDVRVKAALVLGQIAEHAAAHAATAVPALAKCLEHRDPDVKRVCVDALGRIGRAARSLRHPDASVVALMKDLQDKDEV